MSDLCKNIYNIINDPFNNTLSCWEKRLESCYIYDEHIKCKLMPNNPFNVFLILLQIFAILI